ncbi:MAG TPA: glycosyltransferase family 1 protein [Alphaproteobacteria bacterium]|nr:glycosyltransferase family 1 protein [Alphaproteobacteria bacterium]
MKVAIDPWTLASRLRHQGTYVYAQSLIAEFKKLARQQQDYSFCLFSSPKAKNDAREIAPAPGFEVVPAPLLAYDRLWRLGGVCRAAAGCRADLLFAPTFSLVPMHRVPVVCTIHDVTPLVMPSHSLALNFTQRAVLWALTRRSRAIITDSEHSKADLINLYGLPESKVSVVYCGYNKALFNTESLDHQLQTSVTQRIGTTRPYLWHHGTLQPRKNLVRLISAYRLLLERNSNLELDLVLAGSAGWNYKDILAAAQKVSPRGRVVITGALPDDELAALVKGATLAVFPSLYEGFGFPMVEAMACGTPVIAARGSCLPEVSGNVLRYFDPLSVDEMATCIEDVLENESVRKELSRKGIERAAFFDWERCAAQTVNVFEAALR